MKSKSVSIVAAALIVFALAGMALAMGDGNARKGKFLYRKHCRSCHGASASDLSPATYTQAEWQEKFSDVTTLPCHTDWEKVKDADVNDIYTYLYDYAKDSPSPATCS